MVKLEVSLQSIGDEEEQRMGFDLTIEDSKTNDLEKLVAVIVCHEINELLIKMQDSDFMMEKLKQVAGEEIDD